MDNLPATEKKLEASLNLHNMSITQITSLMIDQEYCVIEALKQSQSQIDEIIKEVVCCFKKGGRLFYVGAGTSGRLGVLDASECPPTFSAPPEMVQGIIAGGDAALKTAIEGAEDSEEVGALRIQECNINTTDIVIGIAASGRTPFVHGALKKAHEFKAKTALITCMELPSLPYISHLTCAIVGPEVLSGSTRLKAGTVTKLILNMITTASMVQIGKVYQNLMIDVRPTNIKLRQRALRILKEVVPNKSEETLQQTLDEAGWEVKTAIVMLLKALSSKDARILLQQKQLKEIIE